MCKEHSTTAALDAQYEDIAARLKRCDPDDVAWVFNTISNLSVRLAKAEADIEQMKPQMNYQILEADA